MRKPTPVMTSSSVAGQVVHHQAEVHAEVAGGEPGPEVDATARSAPAPPKAGDVCWVAWSWYRPSSAQQREQEGARHRGAGDQVDVRPAQIGRTRRRRTRPAAAGR